MNRQRDMCPYRTKPSMLKVPTELNLAHKKLFYSICFEKTQ